jgi:WD40 repeat protein/tRNA A-37 threonylcarbamoyl transferase component Bud32
VNEVRIAELHARALEIEDPGERSAFLDKACGDDRELRRELDSLLGAYARMGGFLESSAPERLDVISLEHPELSNGERIGAYEVVRVLGSGGTSTVYEALQARPHRRVALKVMRSGLGSEAALRRFQDEAEILARLKHGNVATVYEAGVHEGLPYFALEFVEQAKTLPEYARAENLGPRRRLELFARVCDAIHHGHEKGIIHRDIKPGNVLVDATGRPKIIDFGIARVEGTDSATRGLAGTLAYMSPEQCQAGEPHVDVRSDVYSLGVVLYELLAERLPYWVAGESITEATRKIREQPPAPLERTWRGDIEAIVRKTLAKDRESRYASAAALADDIRRHLTNRPVEAHPQGPLYLWGRFARRQRVAFFSLSAVVFVSIAAALLSGWLAAERGRERREAEFQAYVANIAAASAALRLNDVAEARKRLERAPAQLRNWEWHHLRGRLDTSVETFEWPGRDIFVGAVSRDGSLAAATDRYTIVVLSLTTGQMLFTRESEGRVDALAISQVPGLLALGRADGAVELRDTATGARKILIEAHSEVVNAVAFDSRGERLATASSDQAVKVWDPSTGRLLQTLRGHEDRVIAVAFDPRGERLASGGREAAIRIWDLASGGTVRVLDGHTGSVEGVAWSPDGMRLVSGSRDRTVRLWDASTGETISVGRGHADNVRAVAFSPSGELYASASYDRTVRLWAAGDGKEIACHRGHAGLVRSVAFLPDGRRLLSFARDTAIKVWEAAPREEMPALRGHRDQVNAVAIGPGGKLLASASSDRTVRLWDLDSRSQIAVLGDHSASAELVAISPDGTTLVTASAQGTLRTWSLPGGELVSETATVAVESVAFGPRRRRGYVGHATGKLFVSDLETGRRLKLSELHDSQLTALAVDATGSILASGFRDGTIRTWEVATINRLGAAKAHSGTVSGLVFSPDGRRLASASYDRTLRLLDARTLGTLATLEGHSDSVLAVAFSPDQTRIASGAADGTVRLWDVETGRQVAVLAGQGRRFGCLVFSPDGGRLVSGGGDMEVPGVITLWESKPPAARRTLLR